ncbi:sporulation-delaying protein SdpB family protein [Paenarthrobacter sp. NPDC089675]|uniref:sporulation-delaying protein SdpB family protein n=1 Tax=Paenarthrobacter sp. NPDC089675 TaxID=3364376 RepID=UPI003828CE61
MNALVLAYAEKMTSFTAKIPTVQVARSVLAIATMTVLITTSWDNLTPEIAGLGRPSYCEPPLSIGLFCLDTSQDKVLARCIVTSILALVVLGVVPAVTSWLHAWAAFSFSVGIGLPDGGEQVSQIVTALLVLLCVDNWSWCAWLPKQAEMLRSVPIASRSAGIRWAAWVGLRIQVAYIYLDSGLSKIPQEDWLNGSAMYYFVRDPSFGGTGPIGDALRWITSSDPGVAFLTWVPLLVEIAIALLIFGSHSKRKLALALAAALHVGIILLIGLWSFGLIMIASVALACLPYYRGGGSLLVSTHQQKPVNNSSLPRENLITSLKVSYFVRRLVNVR